MEAASAVRALWLKEINAPCRRAVARFARLSRLLAIFAHTTPKIHVPGVRGGKSTEDALQN